MSKSSTINTAWDIGVDVTYKLLIENLGGYDAAKAKLRDNGSLHSDRLKKALLEYRRQQNIFEAGDKVVLSSADTEDLLLEIVNQMYTPNMHRVRIIATGRYGPVFKDDIRQATPEEIAAGRRL